MKKDLEIEDDFDSDTEETDEEAVEEADMDEEEKPEKMYPRKSREEFIEEPRRMVKKY